MFSETSVNFQQTTRRYIPEDRILHNRRCENLKSCNVPEVLIELALENRPLGSLKETNIEM
jgi:hypothetical protein